MKLTSFSLWCKQGFWKGTNRQQTDIATYGRKISYKILRWQQIISWAPTVSDLAKSFVFSVYCSENITYLSSNDKLSYCLLQYCMFSFKGKTLISNKYIKFCLFIFPDNPPAFYFLAILPELSPVLAAVWTLNIWEDFAEPTLGRGRGG